MGSSPCLKVKDNVETKDTLELDDLESDEGLLVINEGNPPTRNKLIHTSLI